VGTTSGTQLIIILIARVIFDLQKMSSPFIKASSPTEKARPSVRIDVLDDSLESLDMEKFSISPTKANIQRGDVKRSEESTERISGLDAIGAQFSGSGTWDRTDLIDRKTTLAPIVRHHDSRVAGSAVREKYQAKYFG
jgi:hypothetical protein